MADETVIDEFETDDESAVSFTKVDLDGESSTDMHMENGTYRLVRVTDDE